MALRKTIFLFSLTLLHVIPSVALSGHARHSDPLENVTCQTAVYYSPHGSATAAIIRLLDTAERTILIAMYGLTHLDLIDALVTAKVRGVDVALKTDKLQSAGQAQSTAIARLEEAGIPVEVSTQSRLLHDKFAVIDGRWVITGSFNWTQSAEDRNRENVVILDCPDIAQSFIAEWELILPDRP